MKKKSSPSEINENAFISESSEKNTLTDMWVLDSGASDHMCAKLEWFSSYEPFVNTKHVTIGDGTNLYATGKDNINILTYMNRNWKRNYLANVLHVPGLKFNLFSYDTALDKGLKLTSDGKKYVFTTNGQIVGTGERNGRLFELNVKVDFPNKTECYANIAVKDILKLWHKRLGHQNIQYVKNYLAKHNIDYLAEDEQFIVTTA
jgi:hypothetical protein